MLGRASIIAELRESYAQIVIGGSARGVEVKRLVEGFNGFREAMQCKKRAADFVINLGLTGLKSERGPELDREPAD